MRRGFHTQGYDISRDLKQIGKSQNLVRKRELERKAAHLKSVHQSLLRDWMKAFRTPAMISQPNTVAADLG